MRYFSIGLFLLISACSDVVQSARPDVYYKRDALISYEGESYIGVAVLPKAARYELKFQFAGDLDLFTFRTCHRELTQEEFKKKGFLGLWDRKSNKAGLTYLPQDVIETSTYCPVEVGGFDAEKGRHSWAFIDFEDGIDTLSAIIKCNGERSVFGGVSVCQSALGLVQDILFPVDVEVGESDCIKPETKDGRTFRVYMPKGRCVYVFREKGAQKRYHRFTTIGYESILVRKVL